jgi:hypothetical protein
MKNLLTATVGTVCLLLGLILSCDGNKKSGGESTPTWTDASTGVFWQVSPSNDYLTWTDAKTYCANLNDGSGEWALPTVSELRSLLRGCAFTITGGVCGVTDECLDPTCWNPQCAGCGDLEGPAPGGAYWPSELTGPIGGYWSSSEFRGQGAVAVGVDFSVAGFGLRYTSGVDRARARCVRQ